VRTAAVLAFAALFGGISGAVVGQPLGPATGPEPPPVDPDSYYLGTYRRGVVPVRRMTPLLLSTREHERVPASCPPELVVRPGAGQAAAFVEALGALGLPAQTDDLFVKDTTGRIVDGWRTVQAAARGAAETRPLRVLVKHYPRPALPGRCFTIEASFYDAGDPLIDGKDARRLADSPAHLFEWRKTYQTQGGILRLVEASLEMQHDVSYGPLRWHIGEFLRERPGLVRLHDEDAGQHFRDMGGGERRGVLWFDLACGLGPTQPYGCAYKILGSWAGEPDWRTRPLPAATAAALVRAVRKL